MQSIILPPKLVHRYFSLGLAFDTALILRTTTPSSKTLRNGDDIILSQTEKFVSTPCRRLSVFNSNGCLIHQTAITMTTANYTLMSALFLSFSEMALLRFILFVRTVKYDGRKNSLLTGISTKFLRAIFMLS